MSSEEQVDERVVVSGRGLVDFSHMTSPEDLAAVRRIERVGTVIVPQSLAAAYASVPATRVGHTVYVPDGANVCTHVGSLVVGGDGLGSPGDVVVVVGALVIVSPVTGPLPQRICVVGSVLAPRGSESALGAALADTTGSVDYYPYAGGQEIKVHAGQVRLTGTSLANPAGSADDVVLVAGQAVITGAVTDVGYAHILVEGQLVAPESGREVLEPRMHVQGQCAWYRSEQPWVRWDESHLGADFFRLLDNPISLVTFDELTITPDVTENAIRDKVSDIIAFDDLTVPAELMGVAQALATDVFGTIRTGDGPEG